jgi:hypothetical protein
MTPIIHPPDPSQPFDVPPTVTTGADATVRVQAESDTVRMLETEKRELLDMLRELRGLTVRYSYNYDALSNDAEQCWPDSAYSWQVTNRAWALIQRHTPPPTRPALSLSVPDPTSTPAEKAQDET